MEEQIIFSTNQKGNSTLLHEGYRYNKLSRVNKNGTSVWRCVHRSYCSATIALKLSSESPIVKSVYASSEFKIVRKSVHLCSSDEKSNDIFLVKQECKEAVCKDYSPVPAIIEKVFAPVKEVSEYISYVPTVKQIKDYMYRARKKFLHVESLQQRELAKVKVPEVLADDFLIYDDGETDKILIFASRTSQSYLKYLHPTTAQFYGDGTFKSCPSVFSQLYAIHVDLGSSEKATNVVPVIFGLLPNKTQATYTRFFQCIKQALNIDMLYFKCDFEVAVINAVRHVFPNVIVSGCHFHFSRAVWKKARKLKLHKNCDARKVLRLISNLPLLPVDLITENWQNILEISPNTQNMRTFAKYFRREWLQVITPKTLSCATDIHRTNNLVEGWHLRLNRKMGKHPGLYDFLQRIRQESKFNDDRIIQNMFSNPATNRKKSNILFDKMYCLLLKKLQKNKLNGIQFLRKVAYVKLKLFKNKNRRY